MRTADPLDRLPDGGHEARRSRPKRCADVRGSAWSASVRSSMDPERTMKFEIQIFLFHVPSTFEPRGRIDAFGSEVRTVRAHVDPRPAEGAIKPTSRQGSTLTTTACFRRRYRRSTLVFFNSTGQVASTPEHTSFAIPSTSLSSRSRNVYDPPIHMSIHLPTANR